MTQKFKTRIRELLDSTEDELLSTIQKYRQEYKDLSSEDTAEVGDQASIAETLNEVGSVMRHYEKRLVRVQNARTRLNNGHYGRCAQCGETISEERLLARPDSLFCYDCTRQRERNRARGVSVA